MTSSKDEENSSKANQFYTIEIDFPLSNAEINNLTSLDFTSYNNSLQKTVNPQTEQDEEGIEDLDKSEAGTLSASPLPNSNESMDSIDSIIGVDKEEIRKEKNKLSARKSRAAKKILLKTRKKKRKTC